MKKLLTDKRWEPIFMLLGNIAIFDWLIFPGLTIANTFINVLAVLLFIAVFLADLNYVKEKWFTKSEEEKRFEAEWKEDLEKKQNDLKSSSKTK